jgi:hypothetical protein
MSLVMGPLLMLMMLVPPAHIWRLEKRMPTTAHIERMELETTAPERGGSSTEEGPE